MLRAVAHSRGYPCEHHRVGCRASPSIRSKRVSRRKVEYRPVLMGVAPPCSLQRPTPSWVVPQPAGWRHVPGPVCFRAPQNRSWITGGLGVPNRPLPGDELREARTLFADRSCRQQRSVPQRDQFQQNRDPTRRVHLRAAGGRPPLSRPSMEQRKSTMSGGAPGQRRRLRLRSRRRYSGVARYSASASAPSAQSRCTRRRTARSSDSGFLHMSV